MTAAELLKRFEAVADAAQRSEILAEWVRGSSDADIVSSLGAVVRIALRRKPVALQTVLAWITMTVAPDNPVTARQQSLFRQPGVSEDPLLATLLQPPFPVIQDLPPRATVLRSRDGRPLTLGERRAAARKPDRLLLDRLLSDPDPGVVARLLRNPALTEREAVRIAAWRPGRPEILVEVLRAFRWSVRPIVQAALVRNPSMPPELATRLTLLLPAPKLREVTADGDTPLLVRLACRRHLDLVARMRGKGRKASMP